MIPAERAMACLLGSLCVDERLVTPAWQQALSNGLMRPAGRDLREQLWRLSSAGRAAARSEPRGA
jgi:hypothetical protein